jgi:cytochrome c biogenesis protein CcdA
LQINRWGQAIDLGTVIRIIFGRLSVFTASALTTGGIAALVGLWRDSGWVTWFAVGSLVPWGPLTIYFASHKALQNELRGWNALLTDQLITQRQFQHYRQAAIDWYTQRWYGESRLAPQENEQLG